jgi:hypothetical protein
VGFLIWAVEERRSGSACGRRAAALMDPLDGGGGCRNGERIGQLFIGQSEEG